MRKIFSITICLCISLWLFAQPLNTVTPKKMLEVADEQLALGDTYRALEWYQKAYAEEEDISVAHKIASLQYSLRDFKEAEKWYKKVTSQDKTGRYPEAGFHLGTTLKMNEKYDDAITAFTTFKDNSNDAVLKALASVEIEGAKMAKSMEQDEDITVEDIGGNINSPFTEFSPIGYGDSEMYFASITSEEVIVLDGKNKDYFSKIYAASKSGDSWSKGKMLDQNINREGYHTGNVSFSKDGNTMYFTRAKLSGNLLSESKLYMSQKSGAAWGAAQEIESINGDYIVRHPSAGELFGEEVIFFAADIPGGKGGFDIYYATKEGDASFSTPKNLGSQVNTLGDEATPFYRDGSLYFSSKGHPGIGGYDVFKSVWDGTSWSKPSNMGKDINSSVDDIYFSLDAEGLNGFLVSNRPSKRSLKSKTCCDDIYTVNIKEVILDLEALALDADSGKPLNGVKMELIEVAAGKSDAKVGASSHIFGFPLEKEVAYKLKATLDGYKSATVEFNTVGFEESQTIQKKLLLEEIPVVVTEYVYDTIYANQPFRLSNIYYDYDEAKILESAITDLVKVQGLMNDYPDMVIELSSHTDSRGSDTYNQKLSQRRAESATEWLVKNGIARDRIKSVGYGESQVLNQCTNGVQCTDEEHRLNRRTEFKIISGPTYIKVLKEVKKKEVKKN